MFKQLNVLKVAGKLRISKTNPTLNYLNATIKLPLPKTIHTINVVANKYLITLRS